jgi:hypothetical protein
VKLEYIQPGKPVQNAFIESFNGSFRDECLNLHWFQSLADAKRVIETWREDYNNVRPHSSLEGRTPEHGPTSTRAASLRLPPRLKRLSENNWTNNGEQVRPCQEIEVGFRATIVTSRMEARLASASTARREDVSVRADDPPHLRRRQR